MSNKKKLHHVLTLIRKVHYFLLIGLSIVFAASAVLALRANNQRMVELRGAVFTADEKNGDVEGALRKLREYVYAHMNTDLSAGANAVKPPIQLRYTYERLVAAERDRVSAENSKVSTTAQTECERLYPVGLSGSNRLPCITAYVTSHGTSERPVPEDQYKFDFTSPGWSPDLAGWSIVAAVLMLGLTGLRLLGDLLISHELKSSS